MQTPLSHVLGLSRVTNGSIVGTRPWRLSRPTSPCRRRQLGEGLAQRRALENAQGIAIALNSLSVLARDEGDRHSVADSPNQLALVALDEWWLAEVRESGAESVAIWRAPNLPQDNPDLGRSSAPTTS